MCARVCTPLGPLITSGMILTFYDWIAVAFQFRFMALAIDRRGPSNEMRRQLQPKKAKVRLYLLFIQQQKTFYSPFISDKTLQF